ncbi:MAG: M6 family metalloprotease domain-containing protein [Bacteroidetes bacterium]|nr:MAG: M6 family metalloprotease domain-containing protein [Bacteroidota bacterium]
MIIKYYHTSCILLLSIILFISPALYSVPAYPGLVKYKQPDGSIIHIYLKGDEKINWAETPDGYTILVTNVGEYQYAIPNKAGDLVFSGIAVSDVRSLEEEELLHSLEKGLFFSENQVEMMLSVWEMRDEFRQRSFPTTGQQTMLCILMQTPDRQFVRTQEEFDALFNQLNYTLDGAHGSVRDYYLENSWGQFELTVDVVGPFTAENNMSYYSSFHGARQLMTEGVYLADSVVNFAEYDNSGNGWVDGVYMIFAGYGQEAGGGPNTIWSHAWSIWPAIQLDGVFISRYACSPEMRGNSQSNPTGLITRIGVIGHEFGHVLGAPDFYDTDGEDSGGNYHGTGRWDMMAHGTWNNSGATPAHHNPYTKTQIYNWAPANILESPGTYTLYNSVEDSSSFYRINTSTPGEYYILENRQQTGFDSHVPGHGLLIFHVHADIEDAGNNVNAGHPQLMYPVSAGAGQDPDSHPDSYGDINSAQTPFPGSTNKTSFTDFTLPGSRSWSRFFINRPITIISENVHEKTITFDFMEPEYMTEWLYWDDGHSAGSVGLSAGGVFQVAARFTPEDLMQFTTYSISALKVYVNDIATSAAVKIWQGENSSLLTEYVSKSFTQVGKSWNLVELDEPFKINPDQELWIGAEFDDPGANVFPAGRNFSTEHNGKGNMLRMDVDDPEAWVLLSDHNVTGNWSLQAMIFDAGLDVQFFDIVLKVNPPGWGTVSGQGSFAFDSHHTVIAQAEENYEFVSWTENGEVVSEDAEYGFIITSDRKLTANFLPFTTAVLPQKGDEQYISVYPNPASSWLNIDIGKGHQFHTAEFYNSKGTRVFKKEISVSNPLHIRIDLEGMSQGVYMLLFNGETGNISRKIILK